LSKRDGKPDTLGSQGILGVAQDAAVSGAGVQVIAICAVLALSPRRAQVSGIDHPSGNDALVGSAERVGRDREVLAFTSGERITSVKLAEVRGVITESSRFVLENTFGG